MNSLIKSPAELELELHELRLQLAASQERETKCNAENNWLLKGMAMLTRPQSIHSLFDALIAILRPLIGFEHAAILVVEKNEPQLRCAVASHPLLQQQIWQQGTLFKRVLTGETVALFAPELTQEFSTCHPDIQRMAGSVLLTSLNLVQGRMMLICCHSARHQLDLQARDLLERYRPLMDQALLNVGYRTRLEQLVEEKTRALRQSQHCFRQFAEMASDWFWLTDVDHKFIQFADDMEGEQFTSSLMSQISGKCFMDYLTDRERSKAEKWQRYRQDLAEHKPIRAFRFEVFFNGQARWLSINADAYFNEQGHFAGYRGTVNDITSQVIRNQELKRAKLRADAANQAKSQFLAVMSHEIKTPMQAILGMLELLDQSELSDTQRELIRHVSHSAALLQTLLHDVLDLSRIESSEMTLESIPFESRFVINSVITQLEESARSKGIGLHVELDPQLPLHLQGDPLRLTQILFNLLGNAIKFTEQGQVSLQVRREARWLSFRVQDTGIGIPPEQCSELFRPFRQLDPSMTRRFGGTGLGLVISQRLVRLMGGDIGVESRPGEGSCFWFQIPYLEVDGQETSGHNELFEPCSLPMLQILLVEDSPVNQQVIQAMLHKLGHQVLLASNGREAIEAVIAARPQLVLMDLRMPEMDGLEASRRLKLDYPDLPILALTANTSEEDRVACRAAGMPELISKPVTLKRLHMALCCAMGKKNGQLEG
jgi:two-component system, sensor histidine kinase